MVLGRTFAYFFAVVNIGLIIANLAQFNSTHVFTVHLTDANQDMESSYAQINSRFYIF